MNAVLRGVGRFLGVRRFVADLDRSIAFYRDGLGFEVLRRDADSTVMALGSERVELMRAGGARWSHLAAGVAWTGPDLRFQHFAIVTCDIEDSIARLRGSAATAIAGASMAPTPITSGGAQRLPASTGGVTAWKFRDPDGHPLELIAFPAGVGDARWHAAHATLKSPNLGIDHAAISVADANRSIAFYTVVLGLALTSRGVNQGAEQARLDGLADPVVDVIALAPKARPSPHIELLGYRLPAPIKPLQTLTSNDDPADRLLFDGDDALGANMEVRDPDGHWLVLAAHDLG